MLSTLMTVCTANTCRSPSAELFLRQYALESLTPGINLIQFSSAGLQEGGKPISTNSQVVLNEYGISKREIDKFHSRAVRTTNLIAQDLILVMHYNQRDIVQRLIEIQRAIIRPQPRIPVVILFSEAAGKDGTIPDPHGKDLMYYRSVLSLIQESIATRACTSRDIDA